MTLGSHINLKIEEYRKNVRKSKDPGMVPDVYWKGVMYQDICKIEKELKERADKQKIR